MKKGFLLFIILLVNSTLQQTIANNAGDKYTPRSEAGPTSEAYLHALRSNQVTGIVNPADVARAARQTDAMANTKSTMALNWTSLGPDNYGGKTKAILYDNRDAAKKTLFAGSTGGGIWKSTNEGTTWAKVGTLNLMVSCMVQASNGHIYVGTGDGFNTHQTSGLADLGYTSGFVGNGIWKSTDGINFTQLTATIPQANNNSAEWAFVNELGVNSAGHIFAATNTGLRYSTDGGTTWLIAKDAANVNLSGVADDVQVGSDGTLMAAVDNKCFISKTGNPLSFVNRSTGDSISLPSTEVTRLELAIAPSNPNIMYAAGVNTFGIHIGIYRSADKGTTWKLILPASTSVNIYNQRGNFNNYITVFPNDPDRILIGGSALWQGRKVVEGGLFAWDLKSSGGSGFFNTSYLHPGQNRLVFKPGSNTNMLIATNGGIHLGTVIGNDLTFTVNNRNYITSHFYNVAPSGAENRVLGGSQDQGSIFISGEGNTVKQGETLNYRGASTASSVISTINPNAVVLTSTAGAMVRSEDLAYTFSNQFLAATGMTNPQAFKTPVALWESYTDQNSRDSVTYKAKKAFLGGQTIKVRSRNNSQPFYYKLPQNQNLNKNDTIRVKDIVATKLFIAVSNRVWMTKEFLQFTKAPQWFEISNTSVNFSGIPQSMAFSADGNHLFVGMRDGKLYRISNIALAYNYERADVNSPGCVIATRLMQVNLPGTTTPISQAITAVAVDPSNPNNVLITLGNYGNDHYVFATTNALAPNPTFVSKQGNLPKMPVYTAIYEQSTPGLVMLGTENGIFITTGINAETPVWAIDGGALDRIPVLDLKQQIINKTSDTLQLINVDTLVRTFPGTNNFGIIYSATFGGGLYRCNDYRKPVGINEASVNKDKALSMSVYPNPVVNSSKVVFELQESGNVQYSIFDLNGRMVQSENLGMRNPGKHQIKISGTELKSGNYILKMVSGNYVQTVKFLVY